jgi:hypothetical protein
MDANTTKPTFQDWMNAPEETMERLRKAPVQPDLFDTSDIFNLMGEEVRDTTRDYREKIEKLEGEELMRKSQTSLPLNTEESTERT